MITRKLLLTASIFAFAACGTDAKKPGDAAETDENDPDAEIADETPGDSTGKTASVSMAFGSQTTSALWLEGEAVEPAAEPPASTEEAAPVAAAAGLKISDTLTLTVADFSVAAIKVKSAKDPSDAEKSKEKDEAKEDEGDAKSVEAAAGDGATLADGDKPQKPEKPELEGKPEGKLSPEDMKAKLEERRKDRHGKLAAKKDDFKKAEKDRIEKSKKHDRGMKFAGPYVYDAIAGKLEGTAPAVDLNDGSYRRIEFKLKRNFEVADTDPLFGNVFVIHGTVTKDGAAVPFEIEWHHAMNLRLSGEGAFKVDTEGENKLQVVFDMTKWFDGIDMAAATVDASGAILVNKHSNRDILKALRRNIKKHVRFGKDKNKDGKVESGEAAGEGQETTTDEPAE